MRWTPGGVSDDVEDRRDDSGGVGSGFGGFGGPHLGIGGIIVVGLLSLLFRQNLFTLFSGGGPVVERPAAASHRPASGAASTEVQFVSFVLDDVQKTWQNLLPEQTGVQYRHAKLVLFRNSFPSGCGQAHSATGPFYCPGDEKVYIDLEFFDELRTRFGAPG